MVFQPTRRDRIIANTFPLLKIGENDIQYVSEFRYLGHVINNRLTDDDNKKNNRISIAPYGRNFRGAGSRSDQCSVKA